MNVTAIRTAPTTVILIASSPIRRSRRSSSWAAESLQAPIKCARLDQLRLNPELAVAFRTGRSEPPLHLFEPLQKPIAVSPLDQSLEFLNSGRPANEHLDAARVAGNVRLVLLRQPHLKWARANGAGELVVHIRWHFVPSPTQRPQQHLAAFRASTG